MRDGKLLFCACHEVLRGRVSVSSGVRRVYQTASTGGATLRESASEGYSVGGVRHAVPVGNARGLVTVAFISSWAWLYTLAFAYTRPKIRLGAAHGAERQMSKGDRGMLRQDLPYLVELQHVQRFAMARGRTKLPN